MGMGRRGGKGGRGGRWGEEGGKKEWEGDAKRVAIEEVELHHNKPRGNVKPTHSTVRTFLPFFNFKDSKGIVYVFP